MPKITGIRGNVPPPPGKEPTRISNELKKNYTATKAVVEKFQFSVFYSTKSEFSKGAPNDSAAKKEDKVARNNMLRWKP